MQRKFYGFMGFLIMWAVTVMPAHSTSLNWVFPSGSNVGSILTQPVVDGYGTIYFGDSTGSLYAINPNGTQKWLYSGTAAWTDSLAVTPDGYLYAIDTSGTLFALSPTGAARWSVSGMDAGGVAPAVRPDGTIYVSAGSGVYAYDRDGVELWHVSYAGYSDPTSPVVSVDNVVYVAFRSQSDCVLVAISREGAQLGSGSASEAGIPYGLAIGYDGTIYVTGYEADLIAFTPFVGSNPQEAWRYDISGGGFPKSVPSIDVSSNIYFSGNDSLFVVDNFGNAVSPFPQLLGSGMLSTPAMGGNKPASSYEIVTNWYYTQTAYVTTGASNSLLASIPNQPGSWETVPLNGAAYLSPTLNNDGILYVGTDEGKLYAFTSNSNRIAHTSWPMRGKDCLGSSHAAHWLITGYGNDVTSPAIAQDGTVVLSSRYVFWAFTPAGKLKWYYKNNPVGMWGVPSIDTDGVIYVLERSHSLLYAFNPDGTPRWVNNSVNKLATPYSVPAIGANGELYVAGRDGLYMFDKDSGTLLDVYYPDVPIDVPQASSPSVAVDSFGSTRVYVSMGNQTPTFGNYEICVDTDTKVFSGGMYNQQGYEKSYSQPTFKDDGTIFFTGHGRLYAYAPGTFDAGPLWSYSPGLYSQYSSPVIGFEKISQGVYENTILVGSQKYFTAYHDNGSGGKWMLYNGATWAAAAVGAYGDECVIYVPRSPGGGTANLTAIDESGNIRWIYPSGGYYTTSPNIDQYGNLYTLSTGGNLHSVPTESSGLANSEWPVLGHDAQHSGRKMLP